jgi:hypothetical protein
MDFRHIYHILVWATKYCHVAAEQNDALRKQRRWKDSYDCIDLEGLLSFWIQGEQIIVKKEPKE